VRLFFALWPDEQVRARLAQWSSALRALCGGRPTRPENLHLTLAFLGSVEDARVAEVERASGEVAARASALVLDQSGYWKHNRIAWAGAAVVPEELEALVSDLRGALERSHIRFDAKPFVPHVTLLRDARGSQALPALDPIDWEMDGFVLVRSPAGRGRPYEVLKYWGLRRRG
jgi:2'-5' RNA ligase